MSARTIVITGGTGGIGLQTAIGLASMPEQHRVVVTGRHRERAKAAVATIRERSGNQDVHLALGDLASLASTDALAADLLERFPAIDVLLNNAGSLTTELVRTEDGIEKNFAVNVVAPYRLTKALIPALAATRPSRVLNITGGMPIGGLDPDNLQAEKGFVGLPSYSHSKRALEAMSLELAGELAPEGIHVNIIYPGAASTAMTGTMRADSLPWYMRPFWPLFKRLMQRDDDGKSAAAAARSSIWAALAPELEGVHSAYYDTQCKAASLHATVRDEANRKDVLATIRKLSTN